MIDYRPLANHWRDSALDPWAQVLSDQVKQGLSHARYGDLARWLQALEDLPDINADSVQLNDRKVGARCQTPLGNRTEAMLRQALQDLHPWRKGPFELFGVTIDTEWRSDLKWDRLLPGIDALAGRRVLDVGCGSGYHCWRMLGHGATEVIGIDPTPLFVVQFWALQKYLRSSGIWVLPVSMEQVPARLQAFDTVFSMGVLYHRRSPFDHLQALRDCLRPGGQLVLETLVIEGGPGKTLVPEGRYARMGNVWFLPSCDTLLGWLAKLGLGDPTLIDVSVTTTDEQRSTDWMTFHSLTDFLDPEDNSKTIEGHPAPRRAIVTARAPGTWHKQA